MSYFNEKWFEFMSNSNLKEKYIFDDFIFKDGFKRSIRIIKFSSFLWIFSIDFSKENNENYYNLFLKKDHTYIYEDEKCWFILKNPTLEKINEKLTNFEICIYHINCKDFCELEMINSENENCPICLKEFEKHYLIRTLCGHYFCLPCLNNLAKDYALNKLDNDIVISCPLCRSQL